MELIHQISTLIYASLCCFYLFFCLARHTNIHIKAICKILPLLTLEICLFKIRARLIAPFDIKLPEYLPNIDKTMAALFFSLLGDVYLVYPRFFIYGVISFSVAQCFFILAFSDGGYIFFQIHSPDLMSLFFICIVSVSLFCYLFPKLSWGLVFPAFVYCTLITVMFWCSVMQLQKHVCAVTIMGVIGGGLFYISDTILCINLWRGPIPLARFIVMITYYGAIYFITFSFIYRD